MPEGHTVHRLSAELNRRFGGRCTRSSSPQGRFAPQAERLDGRVFDAAQAHGKHIFVAFNGEPDLVHVHLGLAGKWAFRGGEAATGGNGATVRWRLQADELAVGMPEQVAELRGPAACELLTPWEVDALLARLGPDPLREDADPDRAWARLHRSARPIGALLMDQQVLSGVGNIYRAELLFRHRIDPMTPGSALRRSEWQAMWADLVALMRQGVAVGRIDTVRPEHEPEAMGRPPRVDPHGGEVYVYRRAGAPCHVCGAKIRVRVLEGRNLFWCQRCQRIGRTRAARPARTAR